MKKLITALIVVVLLYCGYWVLASRQIETMATDKLSAYEQQGYTISHSPIDIGGFPLKFDSDIGPLSVSRSQAQTGHQQLVLNTVHLSGKAYSPANWSLQHSGEATWTLAQGVTIASETQSADIAIKARPTGGLSAATVLANEITLRQIEGRGLPVRSIGSAQYDFTRQGKDALYVFSASQVELEPSLIGPFAQALGPNLDALSGQLLAQDFETATPRYSSDDAALNWGDLNMGASFNLIQQSNGLDGQITLKISDETALVEKFVASGMLSDFEAMAATMIIAGMDTDDQGRRELELSVIQSAVSLGPLPLGKLPF